MKGSKASKATSILVAAFLLVALFTSLALADSMYTQRLSGSDRIETAISISKHLYNHGEATAVVLARSDDFPDALAGAVLAAKMGGPLLLTPSSYLDPRVEDEILRVLGTPSGSVTKTVYLLGGEMALNSSVMTAVEDAIPGAYITTRVAGANRFATAVEIARLIQDTTPTFFAIAYGYNFPDALAVSPFFAGGAASGNACAILLTRTDSLPTETANYLAETSSTTVWVAIIGGELAVSNDVVDEITQTVGPIVLRVAGSNRYKTAIEISKTFWGHGETTATTSSVIEWVFARGDDFPDALAGGTLQKPLLLTTTNSLQSDVKNYLSAIYPDGSAAHGFGFVLGGPLAISSQCESDIAEALSQKAAE